MKRIYFLLMVTIVLTSCATFSSTSTPTSLPRLTPEAPDVLPDPTDPTQLITVKAGETFDLLLPSNSSTGYRWQFVEELDTGVIEEIGQDYIAQQPVIPGSGGMELWTFRAVHSGDTTVVLGYYPPSNNAQPEETVTFSIHVE